MIAERVLMTLLIGGVAAGCVLVLYPFFSALLWAAILVFTTWPVAEWLRVHAALGHSRRRRADGGADRRGAGAAAGAGRARWGVRRQPPAHRHRGVRCAADCPMRRHGCSTFPLLGPPFGGLWDRWAADITRAGRGAPALFRHPAEGGLSLLLGIAHGVLLFGLALFVAFFFYLYGEPLAVRLRLILQRIAGAQADRLILVTGATVRGVVYGILGTAIVQGILTALGLWVAGVPRPVLLGAVAGFLAGAADRRAAGMDPGGDLAAGRRELSRTASSWRSTAWWRCRAPTR